MGFAHFIYAYLLAYQCEEDDEGSNDDWQAVFIHLYAQEQPTTHLKQQQQQQ